MKGSVISRDSKGITIALFHNPDDACSACASGDSCSLPKSETIQVDISNQTKELEIHDTVDVEISPKKFLWLSSIVYIFPVAMLLAGALIGNSFSELLSIFGALAGLSAGLIINIKLDKALKMSYIINIRRVS
jgi:positive regulator of sigma E activity